MGRPDSVSSEKTGDVRLCVDFRKINAITMKDSFPLPRIDDVLGLLQGQQYFSTLDLASGYWQIELEEDSNLRQKKQRLSLMIISMSGIA